MMDRESKYKAQKQIEAIQRSSVRPTEAHYAQARDMAKQQRAQHDEIERDIDREVHQIAKDMGEFTYGVMSKRATVSFEASEYVPGKARQLICTFCGTHCSGTWHHIKDKWWGSEHKQFSELSEDKLERERACLQQKKK